MNENVIKTVPNQRIIEVNKQPTDKKNKYTVNNLSAIDEAAQKLRSAGGFKLYIYIAKNQDKYSFALSSSDFQTWSSLSKTAYTTAFKELVANGYLVQSKEKSNKYLFYDKAQTVKEKPEERIIIEYAETTGFIF